MPRKRDATMSVHHRLLICFVLVAVHSCQGASNRRQDSRQSSAERQYLPAPSVETLKELAQAMGAAGFEHYTEGSAKPIVKRLIPERSEPDLDEVAYKGIVGKAGIDFPAFPGIPSTSFNCRSVATGYYADLETDCQVFHICDSHRKISFLCPNGTIFSQSHLICDWWFKVDCASAPALYETSAEQYSQAQKKSAQGNQQSNKKNSDLQQMNADASNINVKTEERQQLRRPNTSPIVSQEPIISTTERQSRNRPKQHEFTPLSNVKATARSYQALLADSNFNTPTQRTFETLTSRNSGFEKRRKNLVQLIANNFGQTRTTLPSYTDAATYRSTAPAGDYNSLKEMQVAAESASFANNNNRQFLQQSYSNVNNFKPYPVYSPTPNTRASKATTPTYTTAFGQEFNRYGHSSNRASTVYSNSQTYSTKRPTLVPYTKVYGNTGNEKHEPYTRPGVYLLKEYLDKEKNKTAKQVLQPTERSDNPALKLSFESVTKIPISRNEDAYFTAAASSDRHDVFSNQNNFNQISTEPTYYNRRDRLSKKLNLQSTGPEPTTNTEKYFGRRPGLIVPPSLTPKTLHSLAIYYATALDNLSTTTESDDNQTSTFVPDNASENGDEALPSLLSQQTIDKYSNLFSQHGENSDLLQEIKLDGNETNNELSDDLNVQQSEGSLSSSPQIRELAQVFTHALSAYLQDPIQFRKVLSDIRPTHPTFGDMMTTPSTYGDEYTNADAATTFNEEEDEILGFSDDNKSQLPSLAQLRDAKIQTTTPAVNSRLSDVADSNTTPNPSSETTVDSQLSTTKLPFRCCGSISASYTSVSTEKEAFSTPLPTTSRISLEVNSLAGSTTTANSDSYTATTENSYTVPKYGGFQNNTSSFAPYGRDVQPTDAKPLNGDNYSQATNLPPTWGKFNDNNESYDYSTTVKPITNSHNNVYEANNILPSSTTNLPTTTDSVLSQYATESESGEVENEEELQRAHSQSFVSPTNNNIHRLGKNFDSNNNKNPVPIRASNIRKPSVDLELPSATGIYESSTTIQPSITPYYSPTTKSISGDEALSTISPLSDGVPSAFESEKINQDIADNHQWSNTFDSWHSTVILDPITLNDGLSAPKEDVQGPEYQFAARQTTPWDQSFGPTTPSSDYSKYQYQFTNGLDQNIYQQNNENYHSIATSHKSRPTSDSLVQDTDSNYSKTPTTRGGRLLKNTNVLGTSTESATTIDSNMVQMAKEIIGDLNSTTTDKLMNVMMKSKSKTVRRLILLLVQTCDDDHNKTAEASKKALLEALMAVSQKELDGTTTEALKETVTATPNTIVDNNRISNTHRRMDRVGGETTLFNENIRSRQTQRSGKSIRVDPSAINALTSPPTLTTSTAPTTFSTTTEVTSSTTVSASIPTSTRSGKSVPSGRRGVRKYLVRTSPVDPKVTTTGKPIAEARVLSSSADNKPTADTRALELLRSLYTIAARWG